LCAVGAWGAGVSCVGGAQLALGGGAPSAQGVAGTSGGGGGAGAGMGDGPAGAGSGAGAGAEDASVPHAVAAALAG